MRGAGGDTRRERLPAALFARPVAGRIPARTTSDRRSKATALLEGEGSVSMDSSACQQANSTAMSRARPALSPSGVSAGSAQVKRGHPEGWRRSRSWRRAVAAGAPRRARPALSPSGVSAGLGVGSTRAPDGLATGRSSRRAVAGGAAHSDVGDHGEASCSRMVVGNRSTYRPRRSSADQIVLTPSCRRSRVSPTCSFILAIAPLVLAVLIALAVVAGFVISLLAARQSLRIPD